MTDTPGNPLLVGIDYSADSLAALAQARTLARRHGEAVLAVHVIPSETRLVDTTDIWRSGDDSTRREQARLEAGVAAAAPGERLELRVAWGEPAACLARIAAESGAPLLFLGRSGTTASADDGIGSVTRAVLAAAPGAVVVCAAGPVTLPAATTGLTVADIMHADPVTVTQSETLDAARRRMAEAGIHQLPVVADGALIGIVSLVDLERQTGYLERTRVDAVMTESPVTVAVDAPLTQAIGVLLDQNVNAVPVLRGAQLVGMLSRSDVLRLAARMAAGG